MSSEIFQNTDFLQMPASTGLLPDNLMVLIILRNQFGHPAETTQKSAFPHDHS